MSHENCHWKRPHRVEMKQAIGQYLTELGYEVPEELIPPEYVPVLIPATGSLLRAFRRSGLLARNAETGFEDLIYETIDWFLG